MNLYLVDDRLDFSGGKQIFEPCDHPIRNPDRSCLALSQDSLHCRPHQRWVICQALVDDVLRISSAVSSQLIHKLIHTFPFVPNRGLISSVLSAAMGQCMRKQSTYSNSNLFNESSRLHSISSAEPQRCGHTLVVTNKSRRRT